MSHLNDKELPWNAKCFWLPFSEGRYHPRSVFVGIDKDGGDLYVGRALHGGHLVPAKVTPNYHCTFIAWRGYELSKQMYEVLVLGTGNAQWYRAKDGCVPAQAFPVGFTESGEVSYSIRAPVDGIVTPGRLIPSEGKCHVSYDGKEWPFNEYEVLVITSHDCSACAGGCSACAHGVDRIGIVMLATLCIQGRPHLVTLCCVSADSYIINVTGNDSDAFVSVSCVCVPVSVAMASSQISSNNADLPWNAKCFWLPYDSGKYHPRALYVGPDKDGGDLYVGRVTHEGDIMAAKVVPNHRCAYAAWASKELPFSDYEVLVIGTGKVQWTTASDGDVPALALPVGVTKYQEVTYAGRWTVDGVLTPGKLVPSKGVCNISYDCREWPCSQYEVLQVL